MELNQEIKQTVGVPKLNDSVAISCDSVDVFYNQTAQAIF
jgi:hypothetical protein